MEPAEVPRLSQMRSSYYLLWLAFLLHFSDLLSSCALTALAVQCLLNAIVTFAYNSAKQRTKLPDDSWEKRDLKEGQNKANKKLLAFGQLDILFSNASVYLTNRESNARQTRWHFTKVGFLQHCILDHA